MKDITFIDGTVYKTDSLDSVYDAVILPSYDEIKTDKRRYAESFDIQYKNTDAFSGKRLVEQYRDNFMWSRTHRQNRSLFRRWMMSTHFRI